MTKWINVKDNIPDVTIFYKKEYDIPPTSKPFLVFNGRKQIAHRIEKNYRTYWIDLDNREVTNVTHWMELPSNPE